MDDLERYQFDLNGFLHVKGILDPREVTKALSAMETLEQRFVAAINAHPKYHSLQFRMDYHYDAELGTSAYEANHGGGGPQYVVDDFLNADPAFDLFVGHPRTMEYIRELTEAPFRIVSSELRYRHRGNITGTHMGGPIDRRNRYTFVTDPSPNRGGNARRHFDLLAVRVLYALHDVPVENGPLCVVPGSHKANFQSPYGGDPVQEPGMVPLPMEAGDALFFTENLRHGGFPNLVDRVRKTVHLCFAPAWVGSQSPAHWNGDVFVTQSAWTRYSDEQRALLPPPMSPSERHPEQLSLKRLTAEMAELTRENQKLKEALARNTRPTSMLQRLLGR
ncbi:phytanoyl-CoA dioxygenase family protein [Reyranella sp.]|uniref:phytanoyl-CoA dioxygenase family protein n=1 Tax=Reyranella sp. TaxID=1929291 RepID=UPI0025D65A64|nr:phytanoyl-CoA dioxygenase family protein [Reyranella sp.]